MDEAKDTIEKMSEWKREDNPLKKNFRGGSIVPTIDCGYAKGIRGGSIIICEALEEEMNLWEMIKGTR